MTNQYYAATAYDSARPRTLVAGDNSQFGITTRKLRENPLETSGSHCREYLANDDVEIIEMLNEDSVEVREQLEADGHESQPWETFGNPRTVIRVITGVAAFILFTGGLGVVLIVALTEGLNEVFTFETLLFPSFFLSLYLIGKLILRFDLVKDKNNVLLNRRTGMITIPHKKGKTLELPFDEFDPYLTTATNPTGSTDFYLQLGHRYSEARVQYPPNMAEPWKAYLAWEYWQQYMDISKPLPDSPRMEPYRSRDPFTAEFDKKHKRPADYWKNTDIDQAWDMKTHALKAAATYPWGTPREQALAQGWRPSGYGEGPSTKMPAGMKKMALKKKEVPPDDYAVIDKRGDFEEF